MEGKIRSNPEQHDTVMTDIHEAAVAMVKAAETADKWDLSSFVARENRTGDTNHRMDAGKVQTFRNALAMLKNLAREEG